MIDRRYFRYFDWQSFVLILLLLGIGLLFVFSATYTPEKTFSLFFKKQLFGIISGLCIYFFFCIKDHRSLARLGYVAYFGVLLLLVYTMLVGMLVGGARRWISLYIIRCQPSELTKLFLPAFIAYHCYGESRQSNMLRRITKIFFPGIILIISFVLILKQPDLGTAMLLLFMGLILLWLAGLPQKFFLIGSLVFLVSTPFFWQCLKLYQQQRLLVLLGYGNKKKEGYQIQQSIIAIGSGGLTGKGFLKGTQNKYAFLPEDHTDFIFSVLCEEWGFMGALAVISLFCCLFTRIFWIIMQLQSPLLVIIASGLAIHLLLSVCINIGMVIGLLPIVGIPLPLFSYGISNLWVTLASLGWINNIAITRFHFGS